VLKSQPALKLSICVHNRTKFLNLVVPAT